MRSNSKFSQRKLLQVYNNNIPSEIPQVGIQEVRMYVYLTPTLYGRKAIFKRLSTQKGSDRRDQGY